MPSVSLPVNRTTGHALLVGAPVNRARALGILREMGMTCAEADEPYGALVELSRRPLAYGALVLSLQGLYQEELELIATVKRRFPHVEVWLTDTDGRPAGLADGMRLGADGLLGSDGLHRLALGRAATAPETVSPPPAAPAAVPAPACAEPSPAPAPPAEVPAPAPPARSRTSRRSRAAAAENAAPAATASSAGPSRGSRAERREKSSETSRRRSSDAADDWDSALGDAVLTAEELRALLHEQPTAPPVADEE